MKENDYKVLMVDDDELIARSTSKYFNFVGIKTTYVTTYEDAVEFLDKNSVSLLLLDINLGDKSGFDLCTEIREKYDMPILFISARTSDDDVLIALNIGGDDYITKPFTTNILLAKVKAVLARYEKAKENARLVAESFQKASPAPDEKIFIRDGVYLDISMHNLTKNGRSEELRDMEYKLLLYLLENAGRVVTRDELLEKVWGDEYTCDATITVHIRELRGKIEDDPKNPTVIKTVWGVGYVVEKVDE
jgi:two-component system response regulator RegX3